MKKLMAFLLAATMILSLAACGSKNDTPADQTPDDQEAVETPEVPGEDANSADTPAEPAEPAEKPSEPAEKPAEPAQKPNKPAEKPAEDTAAIEKDVLDKLSALIDGALLDEKGEPMTTVEELLTQDTFEYNTFIPYVEGAVGAISSPMIGSIPHNVVLVKMPAGSDVAAAASEMEENMDPRKWICVEAEEAFVKTSGQYILLVMSDKAAGDAVSKNFSTVFGA